MIFGEEELDTSVLNVQEKAILDIAEQNKDVLSLNSQKLNIREINKKRILENYELLKKGDVSVYPSVEQESPLQVSVHPELTKETLEPIGIEPNFGLEEFIAKEQGKDISTIISEGSTQDILTEINLSPKIDSDNNHVGRQELDLKLNEPFSSLVDENFKFKVMKEVENFNIKDISLQDKILTLSKELTNVSEIKIVPDMGNTQAVITKVPVTLTNENKVISTVGKIDLSDNNEQTILDPVVLTNDTQVIEFLTKVEKNVTESFTLEPNIYTDEVLSVEVNSDINKENTILSHSEPKFYEDTGIEVMVDSNIVVDTNHINNTSITSKDLNNFFTTPSKVSVSSEFISKVKENLSSPTLAVENVFTIDTGSSGALPFIGAPPDFAENFMSGAKEVLMTNLKETVTDFIVEAINGFDKNYLGFSLEKTLTNLLENIQNKIEVVSSINDREFKLTQGQVSSLEDTVKTALKNTFTGEKEVSLNLSWGNLTAMLEEISDHLYKVLTSTGTTVSEVIGMSFNIWEKILGGMLSDSSKSRIKLGVNPAVDALISAGPDAYKNQYDLILIQAGGSSPILEVMPSKVKGDKTFNENEYILNLLGSSFLAVRAAGINIPEIKSQTVDIPYLWTTVTKVVPQVTLSKKQSLTIEADQYLFMYDSFMKLSGKYYSSSKFGLVEEKKNDMLNFVPVQLGSLCSKSWSDGIYNDRLGNKPRLDMLVKLRNFSPILLNDGNIAAGLEPYFVFEDVRFLGNGQLQFSRSDVSKITFDTEFIYRRSYKVNINSHSGTSESSTTGYIGNKDYNQPSTKLIQNDFNSQHSASKTNTPISSQLGTASEESSKLFTVKSTVKLAEVKEAIASNYNLSKTSQDIRSGLITESMNKSSLSQPTNEKLDELVKTVITNYKTSLEEVTGEMKEKVVESDIKINVVGPTISTNKQDFKIQEIVNPKGLTNSSSVVNQGQNSNNSDKGFDSQLAQKNLVRQQNVAIKVSKEVQQYKMVQGVKVPISSSLSSLDTNSQSNNSKSESNFSSGGK